MKINILNDALLDKKTWRLIVNQDTLIHKCLNAKYFPNTSILEENSKLFDNYVSKSIHQTKDNLLKGCF